LDEDSGQQGLLSIFKSVIRKKTSLQKGTDLSDEIQDLMSEGQAMGLISDEESDMVSGVLDLKETTAHSIMIPRTEISFAPSDATLDELIELVTSCGHTRIPIFQENIDQIVGILHAKDLLKLFHGNGDSKLPPNLLRKPYFVPGNQSLNEVLKQLKEKKTHLAIVTDEYGGTAGIITIEDILEEIVGEIMDEHDNEEKLITILDDGSVLVDARLEVEKLEAHFELKLPPGEFESVGGLIIHLLGRIPKINEKITCQDIVMIIKSADDRRINQVLITRLKPDNESMAEDL
jgi:magnesium and cobalt transporter